MYNRTSILIRRLKTRDMKKEVLNNRCPDCGEPSDACICVIPQHIYIVEYKLNIDTGKTVIHCDESVRCVATDPFVAISIVTAWCEVTPTVWCADDGEEYTVPHGIRDVTIKAATLNTPDVGELLKVMPLPAVFQNEG
jgi:hypothetical protein